jgi:GNAT superfamily N-acetyltransferase
MLLRTAIAGDASGLAELIYLADQAHYATSGFALSIGGTREHQLNEITKLVRASAKSPFHFSHFDIAEALDGTVAASVAGFDRSKTERQIEIALLEIGWTPEEIGGLVKRITPLAECFPPEPPRTWTIDHVATLPRYRGQGLARRLLDRALARGISHGCERAAVDVFTGNSIARTLYLNAGFEPAGIFGHEPLRRLLNRDPLERLVQLNFRHMD